VGLGQQRPDAVRKGVTLLPPQVKALLVPEEFLKRTRRQAALASAGSATTSAGTTMSGFSFAPADISRW
jgi:hypothetical protein